MNKIILTKNEDEMNRSFTVEAYILNYLEDVDEIIDYYYDIEGNDISIGFSYTANNGRKWNPIIETTIEWKIIT